MIFIIIIINIVYLPAKYSYLYFIISVKTSSSTFSPKSIPKREGKKNHEMSNLKTELNQNVNRLISQRVHYENLLAKEKAKASNIDKQHRASRIAFNKLSHAYESEIEAYKTMLKMNISSVSELKESKPTVASYRELKGKLRHAEERIQELLESSNTTSRQGHINEKQSKLTIAHPSIDIKSPSKLLKKVKIVLSPLDVKTLDLENKLPQSKTPEERVNHFISDLKLKESVEYRYKLFISLASEFLSENQLSVLMAFSKDGVIKDDSKELLISLFKKSTEAYTVISQSLSLPPTDEIRRWIDSSITLNKSKDSVVQTSIKDESRCEKVSNVADFGVNKRLLDGSSNLEVPPKKIKLDLQNLNDDSKSELNVTEAKSRDDIMVSNSSIGPSNNEVNSSKTKPSVDVNVISHSVAPLVNKMSVIEAKSSDDVKVTSEPIVP